MGKPRADAKTSSAIKRPRTDNGDQELNLSSKLRLQGSNQPGGSAGVPTSNRFAFLPTDDAGNSNTQPVATKASLKEKVPPFYVKGFPENLRGDLNNLISNGLQATIRLCTDGYKIAVPNIKHYRAVMAYLQMEKLDFFTHDLETQKPFKVVLRGLPDLDVKEVKENLLDLKLDVVGIFKIARRKPNTRYRDQLYLIHLKRGTTTLAELRKLETVSNVVVEWEKYRPSNNGATLCQNCLLYGHGTKNCHMKSRCAQCGEYHKTEDCLIELTEGVSPKCVNCGAAHATTSRSCPKRTEYIEIRKANNQRRHPKRKNEVNLDLRNDFPALAQRARQVTNLTPLPLPGQTTNQVDPSRLGPGPSADTPPAPPPGLSGYSQAVRTPPEELYSAEEKAKLFNELVRQDQACRTKQDQIAVMLNFYYHHGLIAQTL